MKRACRIRSLVPAAALLALGLTGGAALTAADLAGADGGESATVIATAIRLSDRPAYVHTVIDFTGTPVGANAEVFAQDTQPLDGHADLQYVVGAGARSTAIPQTRFGLSVSVSRNSRGLRIDLRANRLQFKYLSYRWITGHRLGIDLWKAAPPSRAAEIHRGRGGCLTLDRVSISANAGVAEAAGRERGVFEHQFGVLVRAADGHVLARRTVHARAGRWSAQLRFSSRRSQPGTLEAAALSPADGALICLVQQRVSLPYTGPPPLRLAYRAHADLNGDRRPDLIVLQRASRRRGGAIQVTMASGRRLTVPTSTFSVFLPGLASVGNVDGRPGDELFVDVEHISTNEFIGVYTYWRGQLRLARTLPGYSAHPGLWAGMTCSARSSQHLVTVHQFVLHGSSQSAYWTRQDTQYRWQGPSLVLNATHAPQRIAGQPSPALVGLHCGHRPSP